MGRGVWRERSGDVTTVGTSTECVLHVVLGWLLPYVDTACGKHRKTLHDLPVLVIFIAHPIYHGGNLQWVWRGVLTHYVLDMLGSKRGIALFYPFWDEEYGSPTGVTTTSKHAGAVTVAVTLVELAGAAVLVHVLPAYLPPAATETLTNSLGLVA